MSSLKEYGDLFLRLNLTELSVEEGDFKIQMKRENSIKTESVKVVEATPVQKESAPDVQSAQGAEESISGTRLCGIAIQPSHFPSEIFISERLAKNP